MTIQNEQINQKLRLQNLTKPSSSSMQKSKNDIKVFIDFFHDTALKIRHEKPVFIRGRDGKLVKLALNKFSRSQLEMLAIWFLAEKPKLKPAIGTMLSKKIIEELERKIKSSEFWKRLDEIYEKHFSKQTLLGNAVFLYADDSSKRK